MTTQWRQLYLSRAKLKAVSRTSALLAGFAMVAMVEVQLNSNVHYDPVLLVLFSTVTTCLVAVHLFALMIATCMLPNIEAVSSIHHDKVIDQSPHYRMRNYIEIAWILSTGVGLVLFLIEIALLIWLKFLTIGPDTSKNTDYDTNIPAYVATALLVPVVVLFAGFAIHFYRTLAHHRYQHFQDAFTELENMVRTDGTLAHLHPTTNYGDGDAHRPVSRVHSGASVQSQSGLTLQVPVLEEPARNSRGSSFSGHFSVEPV